MEDRTKLTLFEGIESDLFSDRQKLLAFEAIEKDVDDSEVADLLGSLSFSTLNSNTNLKVTRTLRKDTWLMLVINGNSSTEI